MTGKLTCDFPFRVRVERKCKPFALVYAKLAYFDSKNFAPMVKCPVLFGTGTADIVCPPATQFAVYNNLTCEKRHEFFEGFGHEEIQDFDDLIIPFFCKGGEAHV